MSINWGPYFIVPSESQRTLSGRVVLRESFDEELLNKELNQLGYSGAAIKATNPWYYRKKNTESWIKIGESSDRQKNFAVPWETKKLENGKYQILGVMHVSIKKGEDEQVIARQNIMDVTIKN
ncbi:MAG: hypothetical protein HGA41_01670 [Syntrophaceae bacterium]|jgi:hypothetical protein|nr:hypothetical protein [Syntrophaceae bacterium]